jgi:serine/threonine protein kinase
MGEFCPKMENVLIEKRTGRVVLIDFGLGNYWQPGKKMLTHCGSPSERCSCSLVSQKRIILVLTDYAAPELFLKSKNYGPGVDIWSFGVLVYTMLLGSFPFSARNRNVSHLITIVCRGLSLQNYRDMSKLSIDCRVLIMRCLEVDQEKRISIFGVLSDPCLRGYVPDGKDFYRTAEERRRLDLVVAREVKDKVNIKAPAETILQHVNSGRKFGTTAGCYNLLTLDHRKMSYDGQKISVFAEKKVKEPATEVTPMSTASLASRGSRGLSEIGNTAFTRSYGSKISVFAQKKVKEAASDVTPMSTASLASRRSRVMSGIGNTAFTSSSRTKISISAEKKFKGAAANVSPMSTASLASRGSRGLSEIGNTAFTRSYGSKISVFAQKKVKEAASDVTPMSTASLASRRSRGSGIGNTAFTSNSRTKISVSAENKVKGGAANVSPMSTVSLASRDTPNSTVLLASRRSRVMSEIGNMAFTSSYGTKISVSAEKKVKADVTPMSTASLASHRSRVMSEIGTKAFTRSYVTKMGTNQKTEETKSGFVLKSILKKTPAPKAASAMLIPTPQSLTQLTTSTGTAPRRQMFSQAKEGKGSNFSSRGMVGSSGRKSIR